MSEVELVGIGFSIALIAFLIGALVEANYNEKIEREREEMEGNNILLDRFEAASEQEKLDLIWETAHSDDINGMSAPALHLMLHWLADYTLEQVDEEE